MIWIGTSLGKGFLWQPLHNQYLNQPEYHLNIQNNPEAILIVKANNVVLKKNASMQ